MNTGTIGQFALRFSGYEAQFIQIIGLQKCECGFRETKNRLSEHFSRFFFDYKVLCFGAFSSAWETIR